MKSPEVLAEALVRQWNHADTREERLTSVDCWPVRIPIGRPSPRHLEEALGAVRAHIQRWRANSTGTVEWGSVSYRSASTPIEVPRYWQLERPSEWIEACGSPSVAGEYAVLQSLCEATDQRYHRLWLRKRHLWREKDPAEVINAARLADALAPGCAEGRPLRALGIGGVDTKFYERHRTLLLALLDLRFDGMPGEAGLEAFLGAAPEGEHWLLVADLDGSLLPFARQRVRATELAARTGMPGTNVLLVENERSLYQLPDSPGLLAILGTGLNLRWLEAPWLREKRVGYWGDLDTWGLRMLGLARSKVPWLEPILMDRSTFESNSSHAVEEAFKAVPPSSLTLDERAFFDYLGELPLGRLEQEFVSADQVRAKIIRWMRFELNTADLKDGL